MFLRALLSVLLLVSLTIPASALTTSPPADPALSAAAARMKLKDFAGAREAALKGSASGARAFLLGMAAVKLELWEEAAQQLATAAAQYPLLADYALYYQGVALSKLGRNNQALPPLFKLLQQYPDCRLVRPGILLYADTLAAGGYPKEALASYTVFLERYPSGTDSLSALAGSAACREKLGDPATAAAIYRGIWLSHPGSPLADKAQAELARLKEAGASVVPYTPAELFKRAGVLYDVGRFARAADALTSLPLTGETPEFAAKVRLKTGQALFRARRYREAEETFRALTNDGAAAGEPGYWLARTLEKTGKPDQALDLWLKLSQPSQGGSLADDALLNAAYLERSLKKGNESLQLFLKYLARHPDGQRGAAVLWELGWTSYQLRDYQGAAGYLRRISGGELREKALYWLGKSLGNAGDSAGAQAALATLAQEYPFGYYSLICDRWCDPASFPAPPANLSDALPMPSGYEREKALIGFGLYDEAARELARKKGKNSLGLARLYLEMGNFNGALHVVAKENQKLSGKESPSVWGISYPLAFREEVAKSAAATEVPESLIYAIMRCESTYSPTALSPVGAVGLMQVMPATAEAITKGGSTRLTRPDFNIMLGAKYLKDQLATYDSSVPLTAAAYNAGPGNVKKWQKRFASLPQDEFIESIPFRETREYVKKVMCTMKMYQRLYRSPVEKKTQQATQASPPHPAP